MRSLQEGFDKMRIFATAEEEGSKRLEKRKSTARVAEDRRQRFGDFFTSAESRSSRRIW